MEQTKIADEVIGAESPSTEIADYDPISSGLAQLRERAKTEWELDDPKQQREARDFRAECVSLRGKLKTACSEAKTVHQDAIKRLNSESERLLLLIKDIESPVDGKIKAFEKELAEKREAKRRAKAEREERITNRILAMRELPESLVTSTAPEIQDALDAHALVVIDESFEDFQPRARNVHAEVKERLETLLNARIESDAEKAKQAEMRAELERRLEEQRQKDEAAAKADEEREAARQAELKAEQEKRDAEQAERDRIALERQLELDRKEAEIREQQAELDRQAEEKRRQEAEAKAKAEQEALEAQEAKRRKELEHARRLAEAGRAGYELAKACMEYDQNEARPSFLPIVEMAREIINSVEVAEKRIN